MRRNSAVVIAAVAVIAVHACGRSEPEAGQLAGDILIDGSSTVYPITEAMAEEFGIVHRSVRVTVGVSGSGGGFKKFCAGETHITDASRPIKAAEVALCAANGIEFVEIPVAFDGLAVVIHPTNTFAASITVDELRRMWEPAAQGTILRWNQIRSDWPDEEIHLYGPGTDSGTYDYFTEAIIGAEGASRGDFQASEDDNVLVHGVATDPGGLGFFGLAYFESNRDRLVLVGVDDGDDDNGIGPIRPDAGTVADGIYQPLSRPLLIYVSTRVADEPHIRAFVEFYLDPANAASFVPEVGYVPMPDQIYWLALQRFQNKITGTVFSSGAQVGVSLYDLLTH